MPRRIPSSDEIEAELKTLQLTGTISATELARLSPAALGRVIDTLQGAIAETQALPPRRGRER